ncbi:MAG: hypothetical protein Salg2KO_02980 [Salibacteraceae bacterium]
MKAILLILLLAAYQFRTHAQSTDSTINGFGFALSSDYNNQLTAIEMAPTVLYYQGNSQFELGAGFNAFGLKDQRILGGRFNYKYFPNGRETKYNMYFMLSCNYTNQLKKTFYPSTYQYLILGGGYGFQVRIVDGLNLGTNLNLGTFTKSLQSENPYLEQLGGPNMFDNLGMYLNFQVSLGYRF